MKGQRIEVEIKPWDEGSYLVEVPALQGCWCVIKSRQTVGKALEDIGQVVEMAIAARKKTGKRLPNGLKASTAATSLRVKLGA